MATDNANQQAFPIPNSGYGHVKGLTKQEYMATAIIQGMYASGHVDALTPLSEVAERTVNQTNILLKALEEDNKE